MARRWRVIDTGPCDPFTNMAIDEAILRSYASGHCGPTLRIYGWHPKGLSLGYSQDAKKELNIDACRRESVPFVRRITGGGIIFHASELTYSLICSNDDLGVPPSIPKSYKFITNFLLSFYNSLGLDASYACEGNDSEGLGLGGPLCSMAKEKYDIVAGGRKIGGNAQRRLKGVIFQHGSIPIGAGTGTPPYSLLKDIDKDEIEEAASLEKLLGVIPDRLELTGKLVRSFINEFKADAIYAQLSDMEMALSGDLRDNKYKSREWNFDRIDKTVESDKILG